MARPLGNRGHSGSKIADPLRGESLSGTGPRPTQRRVKAPGLGSHADRCLDRKRRHRARSRWHHQRPRCARGLGEYVYEALRAGASGFLLKDATAELIHAVRAVAVGDALLAPSVTRQLIADFARQPRPAPPFPPRLGALTQRETEVLQLIAHGLSNTEISSTLVIVASPR